MSDRRRHEPRILSHTSYDFRFSCPLVDAQTGSLETPLALELAPWIDAMRGQTTTEPRPTRNTIMAHKTGKPAHVSINGEDITSYITGEYLLEPDTMLVDQDALEKALNGVGPGDPWLCRIGLHIGWSKWQRDEPGLKSRCCSRCFTVQVRPTS